LTQGYSEAGTKSTATGGDLCDCCDTGVASNDNARDGAGQRFHRRSAEGHCQLSDAADEEKVRNQQDDRSKDVGELTTTVLRRRRHRWTSQFGAKLYTWPSLVAVTTRRSWPIETPTGYPVASGSE
jgi:hypothetical protein